MKTLSLKAKDIRRDWHLFDAQGQILGRLSTKIATFLQGKNKTNYVPYLDCGDYVVVVNAKEILVSGRKEKQKKYYRHSGYPGGLKEETLEKLRARKPQEIIIHAVKGMLPKNKLAARMLKKLFVFADDKHPYEDKFKDQKSNIKVTD